MRGITKMITILLLFAVSTISAFDEYVSVRDLTKKSGLPERITLKVIGNNLKDTILHLKENKRLFVNVDNQSHSRRLKTNSPEMENIKYYQDMKNRAAVSVTCDAKYEGACKRTVEGFLTIGQKMYEIRPSTNMLATRLLGRSHLNLHEVTRAAERNLGRKHSKNRKEVKDYKVSKTLKDIKHSKTSFKRQGETQFAVELQVLTDVSTFQIFYKRAEPSDEQSMIDATKYRIRRYISHVINGVSLMYQSIEDPFLKIYVTISGFNIIKDENEDAPVVPADSGKVKGRCDVDPETYIDNIQDWLYPKDLPHADHLMVFTGCSLDDDSVAGMANVGGACSSSRTSVITYARYYDLATTVAHELGHNLGAGHDGGDSSCPEKDKYLMATATNELNRDEPYTANPWRFSPCSIKSFREFFHSEDADCMKDKGNYFDKDEWDKHNEKLPGEIYSLDKQCKLMKGSKSGICLAEGIGIPQTDEKICFELRCIAEGGCSSHVAARGSPCGDPSENKWCIYGKCVSRDKGKTGEEGGAEGSEGKPCFATDVPYNGDISVTTSGTKCLKWAEVMHVFDDQYKDEDFVDGSIAAASNYCRTPDGSETPWCTTDLDGGWEDCEIPDC